MLLIAGGEQVQIDVVRGRLDADDEVALLELWEREAGFGGEPARRRLEQVVCVVRRGDEVLGSSSAVPAAVELIARWPFWMFGCLLAEGLADLYPELVRATFEVLDAAHTVDAGEPVGLCVLLDEDQRRAHPEAEWSERYMVYAGYMPDGRQLRISYFSDEWSRGVEPPGGWQLPPGCEIVRFDRQTAVSRDDVIAAWTAEAGLTAEEAERRMPELLLVAVDASGELAGVTTAYLEWNAQLQAEVWNMRTYVLAAYRRSAIGLFFGFQGRDRLIERFTTGEDRRGLGIVWEVENAALKHYFNKGRWIELEFLFIGHNARGDHVRIHYFPGVQAPEPALAPAFPGPEPTRP